MTKKQDTITESSVQSVSAKTLESVLVLSVRSFRHQAANGSMYEFEDVLSTLCDATLCCPVDERSWHRKSYRVLKYVGLSDEIAETVSLISHLDVLEHHHDLILVVLDNPWQMHLLNQVKGWRDHPAKKICYIVECWPREFSSWRLMQEPFGQFDQLFLGIASSVPVLASKVEVPCHYLPSGVDTSVFFDDEHRPSRVVDMSYIGRREHLLHDQLKRFTNDDNLFYWFDTAKSQKLFVDNHAEHRKQYASLLKRTAISIALPAKSNAVAETGGVDEIATRFFEFAAAGVVIVGRAPDSEAFRSLFDWPDVVVDIGSNYRDVPQVVRQIMDKPQWMDAVSRRNIAESLRRNDWVYRLMKMAQSVGFAPNRQMIARVEALNQQIQQMER